MFGYPVDQTRLLCLLSECYFLQTREHFRKEYCSETGCEIGFETSYETVFEREYLYFAHSNTKQRVENEHEASRTDGYLGRRKNLISVTSGLLDTQILKQTDKTSARGNRWREPSSPFVSKKKSRLECSL